MGDLAKALGMQPGSFSKYTSGKTMPGGKILRRLIALNISINWFLADIPPMLINETDLKPELSPIKNEVSEMLLSVYPKDESKLGRINYLAHINDEDLNQAERHLLEELKQFIAFLESRSLPPHTKRILFEQLIESIDQEVEGH